MTRTQAAAALLALADTPAAEDEYIIFWLGRLAAGKGAHRREIELRISNYGSVAESAGRLDDADIFHDIACQLSA